MAGIEAALAAGLVPLKLNAVLLRSSWREDVPRLLSQAAAWGAELRFIELMPAGSPEAASRRGRVLGVGAARVRRWLAETARVEPLRGATGAAARKGCVLWEGQRVEVGWITPLSDPFCATCDRIRVDARGRLRRCLMDPETFPLAERLERGGDDGTVAALRVYLARKSAPRSMRTAATMDRTGG
jgi:cyclic pyranopterin phosphate synthase